jgi:hypothetical protein
MAGFQLAGPAADVSKILYGENRNSYQSPNTQYNFDHFEGSRSCQVLKIASSGRGGRNLSPSQVLEEEHRSYRTLRLGVPAKLRNLHSKIGRRVDFARDKKPRCSLDLGE